MTARSPVGERLAYVALQRVYKTRTDGEAPRVVKAERQGDAYVLTYDRPVVLKNDGKGFALLGADDKWAFAQAKADGADVIVFDEALSPAQQRNWEELSGLAVIDRQEVILEIFADRAHTREATLQVALARMQYSLPRLTRAWTHLSRQRGKGGGSEVVAVAVAAAGSVAVAAGMSMSWKPRRPAM